MRYLHGELLRLLDEEGKMAFVAGPRQVGKTTLVRSLLPDEAANAGYFNWDVESHRRAVLRSPERFWEGAPARVGQLPRIVLDEIHKYPRWKRFLKGLFDASRGTVEILVTGSGRLDVYQKGGDSLFGRYGLYRLHPFTLGELLDSDRATVLAPADFWRALAEPPPPGTAAKLDLLERFTGFPEPLFAQSELRLQRWRKAHRDLILREDLHDLTRIRDIGLIDSLVDLLPGRVGSPLSLNALREDLGVAFGTVQTWLAALERLYYLFEIRPYAGRLARALRREGKVYLYDFTRIAEPGPRFENLVALALRKLCDAWTDFGHGDFALCYVRDKEKHEVDFLITESGKPHALIETKLGDSTVAPALHYFHERLRPVHSIQLVRNLAHPLAAAKGMPAVYPAAWFLART